VFGQGNNPSASSECALGSDLCDVMITDCKKNFETHRTTISRPLVRDYLGEPVKLRKGRVFI